jgi:putative peptide zinc metalloprotease protein
MRKRFLDGRVLAPLLAVLSRLFTRKAAVAIVALLASLEFVVAAQASTSAPQTLHGARIVCAAALTALGVLVHELGHLAACVRFGATHGGIGAGIYWCIPVLYAEVNGAWMLPRSHRAVVDIGGVYFQCAYVLVLEIVYLASGTPFVLEAIVWSHVLMLHTLNPVLKYDGYWLLTDLAGAPNLHEQIRDCARQAWDAMRRVPQASLPSGKRLALLGAFTAVATAYFAYVLTVLGNSIGHSAGESQRVWAAPEQTTFGLWHAAGEAALLTVLIVVAVSLAVLLARSIHHIGKGSRAC